MRQALPSEVTLQGVTVTQRPWKGTPVIVIETAYSTPNWAMINMSAQVPLKGEAIELSLLGRSDAKAKMGLYLQQVLDSLDGQLEPLPAATPQATSPAEPRLSARPGAFMIAGMAVVFLGVLVGLWAISRKAPRGITLAVAVGVWVAGQMIAKVELRECQGLGGALALAGSVGGILGLVDLFSKRDPKLPGAGQDGAPPPLPEQPSGVVLSKSESGK